MLRYIIRRILWAILVLLIVVFITYMIFFLLPSGDPAVRLAGKNQTPQLLEQIRQQFGLNHPWYIQYLLFLKHAVLGDQYGWPGLGLSFVSKVPLKGIIFSRIAVTAQLAIGAAIVWLIVGISVGILSALRPHTLGDRSAMGLAVLAISMPVFFLGPLALYIFWFKLGWLPGTGYYALGQYGFGTWFSHWILPWVVLAVLYAAFYARLSRSNLMETMSEDYIRTARAKGLTEKRVVLRHGLRAGITPILTVFGLDLAALLGGAIITESIFNLPGIGQLTIQAVSGQDLNTIAVITLVAAVFVVVANLIVDILYAFLDPRVGSIDGRRRCLSRCSRSRTSASTSRPKTAWSRPSTGCRSRCRPARPSGSWANQAPARACRSSRSWVSSTRSPRSSRARCCSRGRTWFRWRTTSCARSAA